MLRVLGLLALASASLATIAAGSSMIEALERATIPGELRLVELYQQFSDAVVKVKIATKSVDENGKEHVALTVQSGFYIDDRGTVLTNAVPMQEGPRIRVEKDGLQLLAVPIASDPRSNIALIQIAKPPADIRYINIKLEPPTQTIGSLAYAITSPLDLGPTPKLGILSGRESSFSNIVFPCTYSRVSISSGPAEGGSPVFNSGGSLIGISVASLPDVDSSYLVPTHSLQRIVAQLRERNKVTHPIVRAEILERVDPSTSQRSLTIKHVEPNSAAEKSGLKKGDQITQFQGKAVARINDWRDTVFFSEAGQFVSLIVRREEEEKEITLLLESE